MIALELALYGLLAGVAVAAFIVPIACVVVIITWLSDR